MNASLIHLIRTSILCMLLTGCDRPTLEQEFTKDGIKWHRLEEYLNRGLSPNTYDNDRPLLNHAAYNGMADAVELLVRHGADIKLGSLSTGRPAIFEAAYVGHIKIATLLLDAGTDPNVQDNGGTTPLRNAAVGKKAKMVEFLISKGADPMMKDKWGKTIPEQVKGSTTAEIIALLTSK